MLKRLNIRLYPTEKQKVVLEKHFNGYRWCYNLCLEYKTHLWEYHKKNISAYDMQSELVGLIKDVYFLNGCKVECLTRASLDVDNTFKKFYKGNGYPKFKSKRGKQSFVASQCVRIKKGNLSFFKNLIKFKTSELYLEKLSKTKIKQCTFSKDTTGKYWASCLIEDDDIKLVAKTKNNIGIDLGLTHFLITSDGEFIKNNKFSIRNQYKLRRLQRSFSKKKSGGKNREKLKIKIARLYQKITNQKKYFFHEVSNKLIRENQSISCETLKVKNMVKNRALSKAISDVSWSSFVSILEYKCLWYNKNFYKVPTFYASSKTCNNCGYKKEGLKLSERVYNCDKCGYSVQRDIGAAINIRDYRDKITRI